MIRFSHLSIYLSIYFLRGRIEKRTEQNRTEENEMQLIEISFPRIQFNSSLLHEE